MIKSAAETAEMILRIDDVISAKGVGRAPPTPPGPEGEMPEEY